MQPLERIDQAAMAEIVEAARRFERAQYARQTRPAIYSAFAAVAFFLVGLLPFIVDRLTPAANAIGAVMAHLDWSDLVGAMIASMLAASIVSMVTSRDADEVLDVTRDLFARRSQYYRDWLHAQDDEVVVELARVHVAHDPIGGLVEQEVHDRGIAVQQVTLPSIDVQVHRQG